MKQSRFLATTAVALSMTLFLCSCGSGGDKTANETATDTTASTTDTTAVKPPEPMLRPSPVKY